MLDELGIKDAESDTFQGVYAPAGTPKPLIDRLAKELDGILARADVREKFAKIGLPKARTCSAPGSPRRFRCTRRSSTRPASRCDDRVNGALTLAL
jgi:Tripartite tricarboxylate transporter family receptor